MADLPIVVRRTIIRQWSEELQRFPESRRWASALRFNDQFCALGVFADLCTRHIPCLQWMEHHEFEVGPDQKEAMISTHAIGRPGHTGIDIRGLPHELCWILGFSAEEESRVTSWSDGGLPFADIADHLRTLYVEDGPVMTDADLAWQIIRGSLPERDRDPDHLPLHEHISPWPSLPQPKLVGTVIW